MLEGVLMQFSELSPTGCQKPQPEDQATNCFEDVSIPFPSNTQAYTRSLKCKTVAALCTPAKLLDCIPSSSAVVEGRETAT